jgi:hypothetical protein
MDSDAIARWQVLTPPLSAQGKAIVTAPDDAPRPIGWPLLLIAALFLLTELLVANYRLTIRRDGTRANEVVP